MTKRMLISVDEEESRVAIVENRRLENLEIEANGGEGRRGNIYKGVVHKVEQSLQAAFIDFGEDKQGFLPLSEIHYRLWPKHLQDKRPEINQLLHEKQELMVQVVKDEVGTKGATLTTYISLPGRYLVLMPESEKTGVSRRVGDQERRRLKDTIDLIGVPDGFGVIIRTAGKEQRPAELQTDLFYLTRLYDQIEEKFKQRRGAGLVYKDRAHAVRFIRDYFAEDVDEVWCDNRGILKEVSEFMNVLMPDARKTLRLYEGDLPLFVKFNVEDQIESVFGREVQLPSGGSIVIDQTEALVAIDVNSGRVKGQDIEETALKTNLEAAAEVARQARIRDLGGLIVVDFIDMRERKAIKQVELALRNAFNDDKSKVKFGRISQFGLMELSRQRLRKSLATSVTRRCETCDGTGLIRAPQSAALSLLRRIEEGCLQRDVKYIRATTAVSVANMLHNRRRRDLVELGQKVDAVVEIVGHTEMPANLVALDVVIMKGGKAQPQRLYQLLDLIRNVVVRKESSPLPRPEEGLEALELDHNAIYEAIAQRNALLEAEARAEDNFDYSAEEPDLSRDDEEEPTERPAKRGRHDRHDRRPHGHAHRERNQRHEHRAEPQPASGEVATATAEATAASSTSSTSAVEAGPVEPPPSRVEGETAAGTERRRRGFMDWMRRIFKRDEETPPDEEQPAELGPIGPITADRIKAEARVQERPAPRPPPLPKPARPVEDDRDDDEDDDDDDDTGSDDTTTDEPGNGERAAGKKKRRRRRKRRTSEPGTSSDAPPPIPAEAGGDDGGDADGDDNDHDDDSSDGDGPESEGAEGDAQSGDRPRSRRRRTRRRGRRPGAPPAPAG